MTGLHPALRHPLARGLTREFYNFGGVPLGVLVTIYLVPVVICVYTHWRLWPLLVLAPIVHHFVRKAYTVDEHLFTYFFERLGTPERFGP